MPFSDPSSSSAPGSPPQPALPPSRQEIERKLSVHSISTSDSPHPGRRMQRKGSLPSSPTHQPSFFPASTSASSQGGTFLASPFPASPPQIQRTLSAQSPFSPSASLPSPAPLTMDPLSVSSPPSSAGLVSLGPAAPSSSLPSSTSQNLAAISETAGMRTFSDSENELEYEGEDEDDDDDGEDGEGGDVEDGEMRRKVEGERVLKSGYLEKKGEKRKTWKKRWFVLRTEKLSYYKDDREYKLLRLIDLHEIHSVALVQLKKYSSAMCIVTQARTYYVKARTSNDAESWVDAIKLARKELKEADEAKTKSPTQPGPSSAAGGPPAPGMSRRMTGSVSAQGGGGGPAAPPSNQSVSPSLSASSAGGAGLFTPTSPFLLSSPTSVPNSPPSPLRINPSQPEWGASPATVSSPTTITGASPVETRPPVSPTRGGMVSSSEDEDYDERRERDPEVPQMISTDPNKVILSGYLMKMGKRKNWRKRWFVLTSGSLVYCSSHMDTKPHRIIPLSRILDALEYEPASKEPSSHLSSDPSTSTGTPAKSMPASSSLGGALGGDKSSSKHVEHSLKIVTAKKAFILCAPSEEEEIKWLSAIQALVARRTGGSPPRAAPVAATPSPARAQSSSSAGPPAASPPIPTILEQPPSPPAVPPTTIPGSGHFPRAPSPSRQPTQQTHSHHLPSIEAQISQQEVAAGEKFPRSGSESEASAGTGPGSAARGAMRRERSDTTAGKEAVEIVRRRYHPEDGQQ